MKHMKAFFSFLIASLTIVYFWGKIIQFFGVWGGWICGFFLAGPMWYINHHKNWAGNENGILFIDMALAIAVGTFSNSFFSKFFLGQKINFTKSIFILILLCIGAIIGVVVSILFEKKLNEKVSDYENI